MCVDVTTPVGTETVNEFLDRADVVIRSTRDGHDWITDGEIDMAMRAHADLVVADVSTFGRQAGGTCHPTSDLLALAAGGLLSVNSTAPGDPSSPRSSASLAPRSPNSSARPAGSFSRLRRVGE